MIIPSIDIMDGKAVQLRQGKDLILTSPLDPVELAKEFNKYGPVAVVDLDAALGRGNNLELIKRICKVAEVRVGGGIRDEKIARQLLGAGANKLVIGTAASEDFLSKFPRELLVVALDHKEGEVVDKGWVNSTGETVLQRAKRLENFCSEFLCTFVSSEGTMEGLPLEKAVEFSAQVEIPLTIAGGIKDSAEAVFVIKKGLNVQVGMSLYTGNLQLIDVFLGALNFSKLSEGLIPTVVLDETGRFLMQAYSSRMSLIKTFLEGKGIYFSRSRNNIWVKGETSGNTQELISARFDCDRDLVVLKVKQKGHACHKGSYSCIGEKDFSLNSLLQILESRKDTASYTSRLLKEPDYLRSKIMEESEEVTNFTDKNNLRWEVADLVYHLSVLMLRERLTWQDVVAELNSRRKGGEV